MDRFDRIAAAMRDHDTAKARYEETRKVLREAQAEVRALIGLTMPKFKFKWPLLWGWQWGLIYLTVGFVMALTADWTYPFPTAIPSILIMIAGVLRLFVYGYERAGWRPQRWPL